MQKFEFSKNAENPSAAIECMEIDADEQTAAPNAFLQLLPRLLKKLESIVASDSIKDDDVRLIELLSAVCLQSMLGTFMPKHILDTFGRILNATQYWTQYRIARSASRQAKFYKHKSLYITQGHFHGNQQIRSTLFGGKNL